jgi:hypothetical protein
MRARGVPEGCASRRVRLVCLTCLPQALAGPGSVRVHPRVQEGVRSASPQLELMQALSAQLCLDNHPPSLPIYQDLPRSETHSGLAACTGGPAPLAITSRYRPAPARDAVTPQTAGPSLAKGLALPLASSWSWRWTRSWLIFLWMLLLLTYRRIRYTHERSSNLGQLPCGCLVPWPRSDGASQNGIVSSPTDRAGHRFTKLTINLVLHSRMG